MPKTDSILLSIIIPVFNQWGLTEQCLKSLREHTPGNFFEVIVVDNASTDETATQCPDLGHGLFAHRFALLRQKENLGFGRACNLGAGHAAGEYLFFLNNDTILTRNWIPPLFKAFRAMPRLGGAGPLLLYPGTDRVQHLGVTFLPGFQAEHLYEQFPADHPLVRRTRRMQAITGAAFMVPRGLFEQCGGFFAGYLNGCEDLDLCTQIRKRNHDLSCIPESTVYHFTSQTQGRFANDTENSRLLYQRCAAWIAPDIHCWAEKDGYELRLTPWLVPYIALPSPRRSQLTLQLSAEQNPEAWWSALQQEPLWVEGYALLATALEKAGAWGEACMVRFLHVHFEPSLSALHSLLVTVKQAENIPLVEQVAEKLNTIHDRLSKPDDLWLKAEGIIAKAVDSGDDKLEIVYRRWQKEHRGYAQP